MSEKNEHTPVQLSEFLRDPEKELHSCDKISERNCRALMQNEKYILSLADNLLGSSADQNVFDTLLQVKKENVSNTSANQEQKAQTILLTRNIEKKKKNVANLEKRLKELTEEYEKLKTEKENEEQEDRASIKIFQKALKFYTSRFQYSIVEVHLDENDKYCVMITFTFEGEQSKYPIRFVFDHQIDSLISFDGGALLTKQQHEILHQRFKETGNYLALFSTLRHAALKKHKS